MRRWLRNRFGAALVLVALALGGCGSGGLASVPLPGGGPGGDRYRVTVAFTDVLDLVPQASVKVNDVTVGSVERIWVQDWTARVRVSVAAGVKLPDNATAAIRQTSLLGEKFVELAAPTEQAPTGELTDGDEIGLSQTRRSAEVEEVLAALGMILNGGGLGQLQTINKEVAKALEGREEEVKNALRQLEAFMAGLDKQRADIVRAVEALDRLTGQLATQRDTIANALEAFAPALEILADQRGQFVAMLTALRQLGDVAVRVVNESRDDVLAILRQLEPTLRQLVASGDNLPKSLEFLLTFPFPPAIDSAITGDFVRLSLKLQVNVVDLLTNLLNPFPNATIPTVPTQGGGATRAGPGGTPLLPGESNARRGSFLDLLVGGLTRR